MKTLLSICLILPILGYSQCTSCDYTISGVDNNTYTLNSGDTLCVLAGGDLQGLINMNPGSVICNKGKISSVHYYQNGGNTYTDSVFDVSNLIISSGNFTNKGNLDTKNTIIENGFFDNKGTAILDTIVLDPDTSSIQFNNSGSLTSNILTMGGNNIHLCDFLNTGSATINGNFVINGKGTTVNTGSLNINILHLSDSLSTMNNSGSLTITLDLTILGDFQTDCMISVGRNLTLIGSMRGPLTSNCGGANVAGMTVIQGSLATDNSFLDICDAGSPIGGYDVNMGTSGSNVTNCVCTNICSPTTGLIPISKEHDFLLYPNPMNDFAILKFSNPNAENHTLLIYDTYGRLIEFVENISSTEYKILNNKFKSGLYFFQLTNGNELKASGKLIVN